MSTNTHRRVLAIDPGTREMGAAVLEGGALLYHTVIVIEGGQPPHQTLERGRSAVAELIANFRPDILAVERTFIGNGNRNLSLLNVLADDIRDLGRRNRLKVVCLTASTVKKAITGNGRAGKREVAQAIAARYPELKAYLVRDRKWKERFDENMFDAVALGIAVGAE